MTAQDSRAMFDLWYEDHIGDENKPVKAAAWEVWQHLYQPVARTPLSDEQIEAAARSAMINPIFDKPNRPMKNALGSSVPFRWLKDFAHHITQEKQG